MAIADLKNVLSIFGGSELSADKQDELFKEVLLMTLSRAAVADINIQAVEVESIQAILKEHTGEEFSATDIRLAAREELYAEATLRKYLASVNRKMRAEDRGHAIQALAEVFRSDHNISPLEVDFFNGVAEALAPTAAQIAGLTVGDLPKDNA